MFHEFERIFHDIFTRDKVTKLKLPKSQSVRTVLIHSGEPDPAIEASDYFDFIINADAWVAG